MNRKQLLFLESWLKKRKRKPVMIRGARQVEKSTLVRIFAELSSRPLAQINLERHTDLAALFSKNDPDALIDALESFRDVPSPNISTLLARISCWRLCNGMRSVTRFRTLFMID